MSILIFILILGVLVLVHEFGHFFAAKKNGVLVEEFGFGFPPRIFGIKIGETLYSLNLFPIGGFVKVYGEEYSQLGKKIDVKRKERAFAYKKPWQKALIIVSGVIGNFLLGWIVISYLFTQGVPVPVPKVLVEKIQPDSPADVAGLQNKDLITGLRVGGKQYSVTSPSDLVRLTNNFVGRELVLFVERDSKKLDLEITPREQPPKGQGRLGVVISSPYVEKKYTLLEAPFHGLVQSFQITKKIVVELIKTLIQFVTLQKPDVEVAGPIGIAQYTGKILKFGKNAVLELLALLSLNLAVINIFPFPALDGGRLVFAIYEWVTKKRVNQNLERNLNFLGIVILLSLAALVTINDITKIYR